ncbi:MAG: SEC-C domain-containing protein [Desulfobulbaceae bacterium]|nr:SEC-C domain-containing protein [Desulfobulbaceae bacterium]
MMLERIIITIFITIFILYFGIYGIIVIVNVWTKELDVKKTIPNPFSWVHFTKTAPLLKTFYFSDFFKFEDHQKEKEFSFAPNALQKDLNPSARCPCGSGKKYSECHHPELIQDEKNHWRGPKFPQNIYLGYKEKFDGLEFKNKEKAEIILLKEGTKIPLYRYFSMDNSILNNKAIVRKLSIKQKDNKFIFSGSLEIESESSDEIQILIGTPNLESVNDFEAINSSIESGRWFAFIGLEGNPLSSDSAFHWFRYFKADGYKISFGPNKQIDFKMTTEVLDSNIFTLSLPFNEIELVMPSIVAQTSKLDVSLELERENISWDLVMSDNQFVEKSKSQKDSILLSAENISENFKLNNQDTRKTISGPRKIRISIMKKEENKDL